MGCRFDRERQTQLSGTGYLSAMTADRALASAKGQLRCPYCHQSRDAFRSMAYHILHTCPKTGSRVSALAPEDLAQLRARSASPLPGPGDAEPLTATERKALKTMKTTTATRSYDKAEASASEFGNGNAILKIADVGKGCKATATGALKPYESQYGDGFMLEVKVGAKKFDFRVKDGSGNFNRLKKIATTQKALKGKSFKLGVKEFNGNDYVAILD